MFLADTLSRAYLENELVSQTQDSDVRSIRERLFAFELEQIKHGEDLSASPAFMSSIEQKYCLISTSYLPGLFEISILLHIVCVLVTLYQ